MYGMFCLIFVYKYKISQLKYNNPGDRFCGLQYYSIIRFKIIKKNLMSGVRIPPRTYIRPEYLKQWTAHYTSINVCRNVSELLQSNHKGESTIPILY